MKRFYLSLSSLVLAFCVLFVGCGSASTDSGAMRNEAAMEEKAEASMDFAASPNAPKENPDSAADPNPLLEQQNVKLQGFPTCFGGSYVVRVPSENLDDFLNQMGTIGNVTSQSKWSENVTLDYADNEARRETLELEEKKMMELLKQATQLSDIIELEARLSEIHYQLDGYSSTLRRYDDLIDYSTVSIYVTEVKKMSDVTSETFGERIASGFRDSLYGIRVFAENLVIFLIAGSPVLLLIALFVFILIFVIRKILRKRKAHPRAPKQDPLTYHTAPQNESSEKLSDKEQK